MKQIGLALKRAWLNGLFLYHYGTPNPRRVPLVQSEHHVHVNPQDWRARKKIIAAGIRGRYPRNQQFWREAIAAFAPDTVLDIGVNYGECLFSIIYPESTRIFGFEANPTLESYLQSSLAEHPSASQIELAFQLVTDEDEGSEEFFIDCNWSGGSAAGLDPENYDSNRYTRVQIPKASVDATLENHNCIPTKLFFKIDVEGFEEKVLSGMQRTLHMASESVGFIEFDAEMLSRAETEIDVYWDFLTSEFEVFAFDRSGVPHPANRMNSSQLGELCGRHFHTDLVLIRSSDVELGQRLLASWLPSEQERYAA